MDRNSLLQSTFEIVTWPEIQDYMTIDNFREQVCPYKDLGNAKDYIIILSSLMLPQTVTSLFK